MPIPDRIERTIDLAQPPQRVWEALTSAEGLGGWFGNRGAGPGLGQQAGPAAVRAGRPGSPARGRCSGPGSTGEMTLGRQPVAS